MNSTSLVIAPPPSQQTVALTDERWAHWVQKGRDHDRLMRERWAKLAAVAIVGTLLTAGTVLGLR